MIEFFLENGNIFLVAYFALVCLIFHSFCSMSFSYQKSDKHNLYAYKVILFVNTNASYGEIVTDEEIKCEMTPCLKPQSYLGYFKLEESLEHDKKEITHKLFGKMINSSDTCAYIKPLLLREEKDFILALENEFEYLSTDLLLEQHKLKEITIFINHKPTKKIFVLE